MKGKYTLFDNRIELFGEMEIVPYKEIKIGDFISSLRADRNGLEIFYKVEIIKPCGVHKSALFDWSESHVITESNNDEVKRVKQHKK